MEEEEEELLRPDDVGEPDLPVVVEEPNLPIVVEVPDAPHWPPSPVLDLEHAQRLHDSGLIPLEFSLIWPPPEGQKRKYEPVSKEKGKEKEPLYH